MTWIERWVSIFHKATSFSTELILIAIGSVCHRIMAIRSEENVCDIPPQTPSRFLGKFFFHFTLSLSFTFFLSLLLSLLPFRTGIYSKNFHAIAAAMVVAEKLYAKSRSKKLKRNIHIKPEMLAENKCKRKERMNVRRAKEKKPYEKYLAIVEGEKNKPLQRCYIQPLERTAHRIPWFTFLYNI